MKILEKQTSDALKKQLKKMCKRNRRIYLKNLREDSLNNIWIDYGNLSFSLCQFNKLTERERKEWGFYVPKKPR